MRAPRAAPVQNLGKCKISGVGRASGDPQVRNFSLAWPNSIRYNIYLDRRKKENKMSQELLEAALFHGDYSGLREFWNQCQEDEQKSDIETAE